MIMDGEPIIPGLSNEGLRSASAPSHVVKKILAATGEDLRDLDARLLSQKAITETGKVIFVALDRQGFLTSDFTEDAFREELDAIDLAMGLPGVTEQ